MRWTLLLAIAYFNGYGQVSPNEIVTVRVPEIIAIAQQSRSSVIPVTIEVKNGYHIQANKVKDKFLIPSTLLIDGGREFIIAKKVFPAPARFTLKGDGRHLEVYDGTFEIKALVKKRKQIAKGIYPLKGKMSYQACDSVRCLFPRTYEFLVNIQVQ
jgi:hypothetical protein